MNMIRKSLQIKYLTSHEAAYYLRYADSTLRISRMTGMLGGHKSPAYKKIGGRIYYQKSDLDAWLELFVFQHNTGENE